ncbi:hypothetical protein K456DRAFT_1754459 [Colletotrichum gloeosporioides 23]|nr:hypothetical protein K456DRAFT_1754459 [Colletotrichum gloeosporioides 23]
MADSSKLSTYKMYTIGWIAALDKELTAALAMLDETHEQPDDFEQNDKDSNTYSWGRTGEHNIVIALLGGGSYGKVSAATTATCMVTSFPHLRFGLLVGIGAGIPRLEQDIDIRLGDVVVSVPTGEHPGVVQYDLGKKRDNGRLERVGALNRPPEILLSSINKLRGHQRLKGSKLPQIPNEAVRLHPMLGKPKGKDPPFIYQGSQHDRLFTTAEIHCGNIASGDLVVKGGLARDLIIQSLGKSFLCFEMEAAGLMNNFPCLVIKGICDYADSHKNDRWQNYAALAAAAYAKELLGAIDARKVEQAKKIMAEVSDTKQAVQSMNDERLLEKMYTWLSAPDPSVNYHTALSQRHAGTCNWFLHSEQYDRWKTESVSSLWIYGGPGCGKTILSSVIISDLKAFEDDTQHLLFFFFSFTDSKKQSLDGALRSLASQLSRKSQSARAYLSSTFNTKYEKSLEQPSTAQLCEIFEGMLQRSNDTWIVLDALDECQLGSTFKNEGLLPWLQSLPAPEHDNIRILVTSRREHDIQMTLNECIPEQLCLQGDLVAGDIKAFIDETIANWDGLQIWREHGWVQEEIRSYLTENSDGMFRWVSCSLYALAPLRGYPDPEALITTLKSSPKSLDGIYTRILSHIPEALHAKAYRILQFLLYSETPLYLEEIVEIAKFSPKAGGSMRTVNTSIETEKDAIFQCCPNLVECVVVNDESSEVSREVLQLAHCSVRDFLLSDRLERSTASMFQLRFASGSMAVTCLSYLLNIEHNQPLDQILSSYPLAVYAACFWTQYTKHADTSMVHRHLQDFIDHKNCYQTYCQLLDVACNKSSTIHSRAGWIELIHYANPFRENSFLSKSMLDHFAMRGLMCAVEEILHKNADVIDTGGAFFGNSLHEAARAGRREMIFLLLGAGADPNAQGGGDYGSALQVAVSSGHQEVRGRHGSALRTAVSRDDQEVVQLLLQKGANPNATKGDYGGPLNAAVDEGNKKVIQMLLDAGANPDHYLSAALSRECHTGNYDLVPVLLNAGANVDTPSGAGETAIFIAATRGLQDTFELFLDTACESRQDSNIHDSAVENISLPEHTDVTNLMLMEEADAKKLLSKALVRSSSPGGRETAKILYKFCQAYQKAISKRYPLSRALAREIRGVKKGCDIQVKLLLDRGADPNAEVSDQPSLCYLMKTGEVGDMETLKAVIGLLLDRGADATKRRGPYGCALDVALREKRWDLVGLLRDKGVEKTQMYRFMEARTDLELRRLQEQRVQK